jgi:hypothetical protein
MDILHDKKKNKNKTLKSLYFMVRDK